MSPPAPGLRNQIRFAHSFKLKTRDLAAAHDRTLGFLGQVTTFTTWKEVELRVRPPARTAAQYALHGFLAKPPRGGDVWAHREQPFDAEALRGHGIELDEIGLAALARFGPARFTTNAADSQGPWTMLAWTVKQAALPPDWLGFCTQHATRMVEHWPQVALELQSDDLALLDPSSGLPLPYQAETHYPPYRAGETYRLGCRGHAWLRLPQRELTLSLRLPFHDADEAFYAYVAGLDTALGQPLTRKHWYAVLASKAGNSQYERKLGW